jgi:hypothetical protein
MDTAEWEKVRYMFIFFILVCQKSVLFLAFYASLLNIFRCRVNGAWAADSRSSDNSYLADSRMS